jgi:origin recognition complex subunit 5
LLSTFTDSSNATTNPAYHPSLLTLYTHFASLLCSICLPFTNDPHELTYISAARWPGFVQPVIDEHNQFLSTMEIEPEDPGEIPPVSEDARMRLTRHFTPSLTAALEALYPRLMNAAEWASANQPPANLLDPSTGGVDLDRRKGMGTGTTTKTGLSSLPLLSKYILIASFFASTNPPKSDLRMFGRGLDEKKRKRRTRKGPGKSGPAKVWPSSSQSFFL